MKKGIKHIDESSLCISRKKRGRGFIYVDEKGRKIESKKDLNRLKKIVIPPMWKEVMICKFEDGHIQAIGRDAKGRKQYIYHSEWEKQQQEAKFARMAEFGRKLPALRKKTIQDLKQEQWVKTKVLALMVEILDESGIRIGNKQYVHQNGTYGLSTLRRKHIHAEGDELIFIYKGKSNKERKVTIEDPELVQHIKGVSALPGYEIFRFQDEYGELHDIDSHDVNSYLAETIGEGYTSKDFRTWVGSRLSLELFPLALKLKEDHPKKKLDNILIRLVADELGNTPTICRGYYVHPLLLHKFGAEEIPRRNPYKDSRTAYGYKASEKLLLKLLEE